MAKKRLSIKANVITILLLTSLAVLLHSPVLQLESFMPKDDWLPLKNTIPRPWHPQLELNEGDFGALNIKWLWDFGRFTPMYNLIQAGEAFLFRSHPKLWQMETMVIGILSAFLLYVVLIRVGISFIPSLLGGLWLIVRGMDLWVEKQYQEEPGILFLMLAVFFFVKGAKQGRGLTYDWAALSFLLLAGLTKETFVFLYPSVVLFRLFLGTDVFAIRPLRELIKEMKPLLACAGVLFLTHLGLSYYVFRNGPYSQSVVGDLFSWPMPQIIDMIGNAAPFLAYFVPALGIALLIPSVLGKKSETRRAIFVALILSSWLLPQIFIFKNIGFLGHYIFTALPALIVLNVLGLQVLLVTQSRAARLAFAAVTVFCALTLFSAFPKTRNVAEQKSSISNTYGGAVEQIFDQAQDESRILIVSDRPWWGVGISLLVDLSQEGLDCPVHFDYPAYKARQSLSPPRGKISENLLSRYMISPLPDDVSHLGIIFTTYPAQKFLDTIAEYYPWFDAREWEALPIRSEYNRHQVDGLNPFTYSKHPQSREYTILIRKRRKG